MSALSDQIAATITARLLPAIRQVAEELAGTMTDNAAKLVTPRKTRGEPVRYTSHSDHPLEENRMTVDLSRTELVLLTAALKSVVDSAAAHAVITIQPSSAYDLLKLKDKLLQTAKDAQ